MLAEILQGLVKFGYGLFRILKAILFITLVIFAIVIIGETSRCHSSPSSDNAVHWRP